VTVVRLLTTHEDVRFVRDLGAEAFAPYSRDAGRSMLSIIEKRGNAVYVAHSPLGRAGFVVLHVQQLSYDFGPWRRPLIARIDAIAVRPEARGGGVGHRLVEAAEEAARARTARSMTLMTAERNTPARRLFARAGYVDLVHLERFYARGQTAMLMQKAFV
jgi:ribosomal protein S18 acetylase RimI-like enzyme